MTDLSSIKSGQRKIEILHPATGDRLGIRVTLVSIDDERMTRVKRRITDERLRLEARGKVFKAEEIETNRNNILFSATIDWEWYEPIDEDGKPTGAEKPTFHGEVPVFNRKNFEAVLDELPWFADQINEAVSETKAFFTNSKPN